MKRETIDIDQESYKLLVESVIDYAIFMIDADGYIVSWNKGGQQIKGYLDSEIIGKHISVFYTVEDVLRGIPDMNLKKARELGKYEVEGWRVRKDGSVFWANIIFTALKDITGKFVGFGKVTRDLSLRRKADEEIRMLNMELESRLIRSESEIIDYKHALDESSIVAITDQKGMIRHVNDNFCQISQYSREELIGQDHRIINSGYHSKSFIRDLWVTIANGKIWRGELKNRAKDGSYYWVDTTIVPFLNELKKPNQYLAIRTDITQRKLVEESIYRLNEDLERKISDRTTELTAALDREMELSELKSRFVSMASHEFRTPLSAILSSLYLIEHYSAAEQSDKRSKHFDRIKSSVKNLTELLDDFLSLDKLEQGRVEVTYSEFNLDTFIQDIIEELEGMTKRKDQKICYEIKGSPEVNIDRKILRNIMLNLLSNAVKYSAINKEIALSATILPERLTLSVQDRGIGIPENVQHSIFEKFFRAGNAVHIQGTGLGLNIVQKYVELLNGNIRFASTENEGSIFTVDFPQNVHHPTRFL